MIPKVGGPADVELVCTLLSQIEQARRLERPVGVAVLIETAQGMADVEAIAACCPDRLEAMVFGVADFAASMQSHTTTIGGADRHYSVLTDPDDGGERSMHWGDQWHFALARIAVACRANGLRPIDGPYGDFQDAEGYLSAARRAAILGYEGKWAIHPSQIPLANAVFTPAQDLIEQTHRIVAAMEEAERDGSGAVSLDGRLIDAASLRMAENLMAKLEQIDAREQRASATTAGAGS
jgi:malyl-CoA/(S)-citramalyl-CoA lyase